MRTITVSGFCPIAKSIQGKGVDVDALLREVGGPEVMLEGQDCISLELVYNVMHLAAERSANPDIGLNSYNYLNLGALGVAGFPSVTSPTLGAALERFAKYFPLIITGTQILIEQGPAHFKITGLDEDIPGCPVPRAFTDTCAALQLAFVHFLAPETKPSPLLIELPYPRPSSTCKLEQLFGNNLTFDAPHLVLTFSREVFDLKLTTANTTLEMMHCEYADEQLLERVDSLQKAQVSRLVYVSLTQGKLLTLEMAASMLRKSRRSLQNALRKEDTHFSAIQDECRRRLARNLLLHSSRSLKYISTLLGFHELSSFHKACFRWFDQPPGQFRNND
ncbi:AraC family transcriptional regulator ligand-binding domain-containing protein [Pseudomonas syringae]|nr:AraC family transcriptional regulator ligand-binding domain-containing protein [Pseudomonas syringae]